MTKFNGKHLQRECCVAHSSIGHINLLRVNILDLNLKHFISTNSTPPNGRSHKTKYSSLYLGHAAVIDINNHVLTGSDALEDVLHIKSSHLCKFTAITGCLFSNAYLSYWSFKDKVRSPTFCCGSLPTNFLKRGLGRISLFRGGCWAREAKMAYMD